MRPINELITLCPFTPIHAALHMTCHHSVTPPFLCHIKTFLTYYIIYDWHQKCPRGRRPAPSGSRSLVGRAGRRVATLKIREIHSRVEKQSTRKIILCLGCYFLHGASNKNCYADVTKISNKQKTTTTIWQILST